MIADSPAAEAAESPAQPLLFHVRPTHHPPGTLGKFETMCRRAARGWPLFVAGDASLQARANYHGYFLARGEFLDENGQPVESVFQPRDAVYVTRSGKAKVKTILERVKAPHQGRKRTRAEKAKAQTPEAKKRDAQRKRQERAAARRERLIRADEEKAGCPRA